MKKLLLVTPLLLASCATNYDGYAEANVKIAQARAQAAGPMVAAISALVRPGITWCLFFMYTSVKAAAIVMAFQTGAAWIVSYLRELLLRPVR